MLKRTIVYFSLSFGFSWAVFAAAWGFGLFRNGVGLVEGPFLFIFMWGPAIGAVVATAMFDRARWRVVLGLASAPNWWWAGSALAAASIVLVATYASALLPNVALISLEEGIARALPEQPFPAERTLPPLPVLLVLSLLGGALLNGVLTLSEELGWRGYLWNLWRPLGFWRACFLTGLVWGVWHAPVIAAGYNYPDAPVAGPLLMTVFTLLLCPTMGHFREKAGSVFGASIFHGVLNAFAPLSLFMIAADSILQNGILGLPGFTVLACANLIVFWRRREAGG